MAKKDKVRKKIADIFDLPPDIVLDLPRIILVGRIQLYIENHKGITLYDENEIRISVNGGGIVIGGKDLQLRTVYNDDIYIEGEIHSILLEGDRP
ncbi:MAG: sporulation protein YqfC [Bacillota bacterium]